MNTKINLNYEKNKPLVYYNQHETINVTFQLLRFFNAVTEIDLFCSYCKLLHGISACLYKRLEQWIGVCVCVSVHVRMRMHMRVQDRERQ